MTTVHDFVSPFDLKNCKVRLENKTEKTSIMASRYARRTQVDVWDINKYTAGFKVYKAPRSSFQINISWFNLQVSGKLQHRPDGSGTLVVYEVRQNPIGMIAEWVGAISLGVLVVLMLHNQLYTSFFEPLAIIVFVLSTAFALGFTFFYRTFTRSELESIVQRALGDLDPIHTNPKSKRKNF